MLVNRRHKLHKTLKQVCYLVRIVSWLTRGDENNFEFQQQTREDFNQLFGCHPVNTAEIQVWVHELRLLVCKDAKSVELLSNVGNFGKVAEKKPGIELKWDEIVL